jgi:mannose/fructose/N-acetylgalactosamine-specific phosphotransferase system component IIB
MDIALVRIDNRLVHGQILEAWVPYVEANCIVVVDDHVASDFFRETVIKMAVPRDIEVIITSVDEFSRNFTIDPDNHKRTIILFSDIADALRAFKLGFKFDRLNIGNVHNENCVRQCSPSVLLGSKDIEYIDDLINAGVKIDMRRIPRERPQNVQDILDALRSDGKPK